jgi:putative ABC transport system ATP-binding protein
VSHLLSTTARIWNSAADLPGLLEGMALSALWSREAGSLSGGEQRRVALARAALTRPGLLLADEPTAGLDPLQGWHCLELLLGALAPEGGALICSHDREGVEPLCHRALELGPSGLGPPSAPLSAGWL